MNMRFLHVSLSRLAIAATILGAGVGFAPTAVEAREPCGSFTINWGGTVSQGDILKCAAEYGTGAGHRDRYYLEIKGSKIQDNFQAFEISFPENFDGRVNAEKIRVFVNDKQVELVPEQTLWDPSTVPNVIGTTPTRKPANSDDDSSDIPAITPSPNRDGELVFRNGELVFLDAETLAAERAANQNSNSADASMTSEVEPTSIPEAMEEDSSDEPRSRSLFITLAEPLEKESSVEIVLDDVWNPSRGGMYLISAFARSNGDPLPSRLGAWFFDIDH